MNHWNELPWHDILTPKNALEVIVRGSLTYLGLVILLKLVMKRQTGNLSTSDLLVIVLISDASQNAMAGPYVSVPDGILLVATLVFWDYALDWLSYRWPFLGRLLSPPPVLLVKNGRINQRNMRHELISKDELWSALRRNGVEDLAEVRHAYMESEGDITVIKK